MSRATAISTVEVITMKRAISAGAPVSAEPLLRATAGALGEK